MIYIYFDKETNKAYMANEVIYKGNSGGISSKAEFFEFHDIEAVTADKDRGQICMHSLGKGIVAEFPLGRTVLTCQLPY